jgi:hypothetical protein
MQTSLLSPAPQRQRGRRGKYWRIMKEGKIRSNTSFLWYQNNWDPAFSCQHERRIGLWGDGGKWVCDTHRILKKPTKSCLVYSVGSKNEFSFWKSSVKAISPDCEIHTIDPTVETFPEIYRHTKRSISTSGTKWSLSQRMLGLSCQKA